MKTIGEKIFEIRKSKGLSQEELSESARINLRTIQRIEKEECEPRGNTLRLLCQVLDVNIEEIYDYSKEEDKTYLVTLHLSALSFIVIPLGNIILPMILWLVKRNKILFLNELGRDLLNFQITWSLFTYCSFLIYAYIKINHQPYFRIFIIAFFVLYVLNIIYTLIVNMVVNMGRIGNFYPVAIRLIRK